MQEETCKLHWFSFPLHIGFTAYMHKCSRFHAGNMTSCDESPAVSAAYVEKTSVIILSLHLQHRSVFKIKCESKYYMTNMVKCHLYVIFINVIIQLEIIIWIVLSLTLKLWFSVAVYYVNAFRSIQILCCHPWLRWLIEMCVVRV